MKILVTGACGNMGPHITRRLVSLGHEVSAFDISEEGLAAFKDLPVKTFCGNINDADAVDKAVAGQEAVFHLAWSFAETLPELLKTDVAGYQNLLDAAVKHSVRHVLNTTTCVSYGKPAAVPVDESQKHMTAASRNPVYAIAKQFTQQMGDLCTATSDVCVNTLMVWYAYGDVIGGRTLRGMIRDAIVKGEIRVPAGSGGSFLQLDDYVTLALAVANSSVRGELINAASIYLTWEEVSELICSLVNPDAKVTGIPLKDWTGNAFQADDWPLSLKKAETLVGYKSPLTKESALKSLAGALEGSIKRVRSEIASGK